MQISCSVQCDTTSVNRLYLQNIQYSLYRICKISVLFGVELSTLDYWGSSGYVSYILNIRPTQLLTSSISSPPLPTLDTQVYRTAIRKTSKNFTLNMLDVSL